MATILARLNIYGFSVSIVRGVKMRRLRCLVYTEVILMTRAFGETHILRIQTEIPIRSPYRVSLLAAWCVELISWMTEAIAYT